MRSAWRMASSEALSDISAIVYSLRTSLMRCLISSQTSRLWQNSAAMQSVGSSVQTANSIGPITARRTSPMLMVASGYQNKKGMIIFVRFI